MNIPFIVKIKINRKKDFESLSKLKENPLFIFTNKPTQTTKINNRKTVRNFFIPRNAMSLYGTIIPKIIFELWMNIFLIFKNIWVINILGEYKKASKIEFEFENFEFIIIL